jgi:hypothetical protein
MEEYAIKLIVCLRIVHGALYKIMTKTFVDRPEHHTRSTNRAEPQQRREKKTAQKKQNSRSEFI